jgi:hypothetical protein
MSTETSTDDCPGCGPAMINAATGQPLPESDPVAGVTQAVWRRTSRWERECLHRVTCLHSTASADLLAVQSLVRRIRAALAGLVCDGAETARH